MRCPECGSSKTRIYKTVPYKGGFARYWRCKTCKAEWQTG